MTIQQMIDELAASLGNRTDITNARYIQWLNWALFDVCGQHRRRSANSRLFKSLERFVMIPVTITTGTVTSATSTTLASSVFSNTNYGFYDNYVIEITDFDEDGSGVTTPSGLIGQQRIVVYSIPTSETVIVEPPFITTPIATYTTFELYRRIYELSSTDIPTLPTAGVWGIQRLEDIENKTILELQSWETVISADFTTTGTPTAFAHRGNSIVFNVTPVEDKWYRMWYYAYPTLMLESDLTASCDLPVYWHEQIVLGAIYRGFQKLMEPDRAAQALSDYTAAITYRIDQDELENDQIQHALKVKFK
jgi:hypothetical protein